MQGLEPAHLELYLEGAEALSVLHHMIDSAKSRIDVIMFEWQNDSLGEALAAHLAAKAGPNLRVRILVDGGGNLVFGDSANAPDADVNRVVRKLGQKPYVELLRIRNPFGRFDHRKLVIIDGVKAWTGGRNFTYRGFFQQHDLSFTVEGPLVLEMENEFEAYWQDQGGKPLQVCAFSSSESNPSQSDQNMPVPSWSSETNGWASLVGTGIWDRRIEAAVYEAVDRAINYVYLENYTCSDNRLLCKLADARKRGVDVRVVLTLSSGTEVIDRTNRVTVNRLLRAGVRVYLYPIMTHVKAATADGIWAYIGTGNFDPLSLRHNHELGLCIRSSPVIQELEQRLFLTDFRPEWEIKEPLPVSARDYWSEFISSCFL